MKVTGSILKMNTQFSHVVEYSLPLGDQHVDMNSLLGKNISLKFTGNIFCIATGEKIKKSFGQGYSYKAFMTLPECDTCIIRPHLCHFARGTCRDESWGKAHCFIDHIVYLSVTSDVKVGITRHTQVPTRWIDQGANFALPILRVKDRRSSGIIEHEIAQTMSDRTNWRQMLTNQVSEVDLYDVRDELFEQFGDLIDELDAEDLDEEVLAIDYPILEYPKKVKSLSFDKNPEIEGNLRGIKGQYLIFDNGRVVNLRKHQGYEIELCV